MADKIIPGTQNVMKALVAIQSQLKPLKANAKGHHGGYANLEKVMEVLQPLLDAQGVALIQKPVGGASGTCTLETILHHCESGEEIVSSITIPMQRANDPQAYGAAMTFGRRYSLMCLFGMVTEDDNADSTSYTLEKLLRELSATTSIDEMNNAKEKHFSSGSLQDKFWNNVYNILYQRKADALRSMGT